MAGYHAGQDEICNHSEAFDLHQCLSKNGRVAFTRREICAPMDFFMSFLSDDFLLQSAVARELYHGYAKDEPILDYHCHLPPDQIASNMQFRPRRASQREQPHGVLTWQRCRVRYHRLYQHGAPLARYLDELDKTNELPQTVLYDLNPSDNYVFALSPS